MPPAGRTLVHAVVEADRPDVVVILLGVNDIYYERRTTEVAELVERIGARLETIAADARATGATVLVATALPNRRDPCRSSTP